MSAIFISHSSKDNAWAERIAAWLREQGHESLFLDFDPQNGIPAGRDWNKDLHHRLRRCRAVIALLSEHFAASDWCKGEAWIASNLGKSLFPVRVGPCELPQMLRSFQAIDLTIDPNDGFRRLARGLAEAGLDPKDIFQWDSSRPPYPGLMAFQEADAPVFFGRDREIQEGLDRLHNLRRYGGKALLLVLGASGCGKSSLVRAGIVPRLRRDPENWLVLEPFRPGTDPFAELADVLGKAFRAVGENPPAPPSTARELKNQLEDLRRSGGHRDASVVIVIDQFEELLAGEGSGSDSEAPPAGEPDASTAAERFLDFLREVTGETDGRLVVLATLPSDFLGSFQCHPTLVGLSVDQFLLGPMEAPAYARVIEGPAEVAGLQLEPGLTDRMVADTRTGDALPLLAFTLRELWERYGKDGDLTLTEYEHLGGLEGSVQRAADAVLAARALRQEEEEALRRAFLQLCRINEEGQHARITARWEAMPPASKETLQRFVDARLLVSGKVTGTIEVAHEALLRTWPLLKGWLEESREFLLWKSRFQGAMGEYLRSGTLLAGKPLEEAERWRAETAEGSGERKLIEASLAARKRQRRRNRVLAAAGGLAVAAFTGGLWWQLRSIREWQTRVFEKEHLRLIDSDPLESVVNGLAALARRMDSPGSNYQLSWSLARAIRRNLALSRPTPPAEGNHGMVISLVELENGELISGGADGTLRRWKDGKLVGDGQPIDIGFGSVTSLVKLKNGELISGSSGGTLQHWKDGKQVGQPIDTGHGVVFSLVELKNGELISGGEDGTLRRWRDGKQVGQPIDTGHGVVFSLVELKNGELISGGEDGTLRRWKDGKQVRDGQPIDTGQGSVASLVQLKNGELISGGKDGSLRRWKDGKPVGDEQPIPTGQGWIYSLVELKNGELISSGADRAFRRWKDGKPVDDGQPIPSGQSWVYSLIELKNGELVSGGRDGTLRRWKDGKPVGQPIDTGHGVVYSLVELKNGELISGGSDGTLRRWKAGKPLGLPIDTGHGRVDSLVVLKNGELISSGADGTLRRWKDGKPVGQPIPTGHTMAASLKKQLVELRNGELISGGSDGTLRRWRDGKAVDGGQPIQSGQGAVMSLIELKNGELVSGGDGTLRRWKDGKPVGQPIDTGQYSVYSLVELKSGELISGGADGTLRRWKDGKPVGDGKPIAAGQGWVLSLVELKNGELISSLSDGTLFFLSPGRIVRAACEELKEVLLHPQPENLADQEVKALCNRLGFHR